MKMIVALLLVALASMTSASYLAAGTLSVTSYSLPSTGFCIEVEALSGSGTVTFSSTGLTSLLSQVLGIGGALTHYVPPSLGSLLPLNLLTPPTLNVAITASVSLPLNYTVFTSATNPCDPNPCNFQHLCVPQPLCTHRCDPVPTYDCASNNPCTAGNIAAGLYYFANVDSQKYVFCAGVGICNLQTCGSLFWSQQLKVCLPFKK